MLRSDFFFELPDELIAQEPRPRGRSRMLVVTPTDDAPRIEHDSFANFPSRLNAGDVLVLNDTRVIPARLFARPKGQMKNPIEFLLTREREPRVWETWCRPAKRVKPGDVVTFSDALQAEIVEKDEGTVTIRFIGDMNEIETLGIPPLPPYIHRDVPRPSDKEAYQTVYAAASGAIAAPTAGLHFTPQILDEIAARGIDIVRVTLHVGIGTFKPVKVERIDEHRMDSERYEITDAAAARLNRALDEKRPIVAVGTTSVRTLESAIRAGDGRFAGGRNETSIFITPGFTFRAVDRLLTNFHLPESTLMMLISAFAGMQTIRTAYAEAIREKYLFYSYGDCMFLTGKGAR
ncbi:MAG TPA: tRNA preQ1(34) S-adenosylmethionine ribosyltransferase-isomerase QueA [Thermoanaerobaculia bacterium]|nr:tRNA preQ1(34) S-adenosylmethionine ribosyltransferase-isomerase QueA [Thermoanaerobaculia bacterium]